MAYATEGFPKCTALIAAIDKRHWRDPRMCKPYWAACVIAETLPEQALVAVGYDYRDWQATDTFPRLERALSMRSAPKTSLSLGGRPLEQLKAYLGSRGVKPSTFKSDDDYWDAATALWPTVIKRGARLAELLKQIQSMSKAQRRVLSVNPDNPDHGNGDQQHRGNSQRGNPASESVDCIGLHVPL